MFEYKGCTGKKSHSDIVNSSLWFITYEDGTKDVAHYLSIAIMLCDGRLKRASL